MNQAKGETEDEVLLENIVMRRKAQVLMSAGRLLSDVPSFVHCAPNGA